MLVDFTPLHRVSAALAASDAVAALLAQPLPYAVRAEVAGWGRLSVT